MINPLQIRNISATSTAVLATHQGVLGGVNINTPAASAVLTLYNGSVATNDVIAAIDCGNTTHFADYVQYHLAFSQGLTAVLSGGNANVTITYEGYK